MNNNRLGCLTGSGLIAGGLTLLIIAGFAITRGGVLYSPGALNAQAGASLGGVSSHAGIGGECGLCHTPFWSAQAMADRCMACHTDVAGQLSDAHSLHGVLLQNSANLACRSCHPDHRGPDATLTNISNFAHITFGFSLTAHPRKTGGASFICTDCHGQDLTTFDQAVCQTCHTQMDSAYILTHTQDFGTDCLACHDGIDTYGRNFDHNGVTFQLVGKHAQVSCAQCHANARSLTDLRAAPTDCYTCHSAADTHRGAFGTNCSSCHTPVGWTPASFDHSLSAFPLTGAHVNVACAQCHVNNVFTGTPTDCYSCHRANDAHQGQFGTDCAACHTTAAWKPANFDHSKSNFPLTGAHVNVACAQCHINNVFAGTPKACASCHTDPAYHAGLFSTECSSCHNTSAWMPAVYNRSHRFEINHGGAGGNCRSCHPVTLASYDCSSCHPGGVPNGDGGGGGGD